MSKREGNRRSIHLQRQLGVVLTFHYGRDRRSNSIEIEGNKQAAFGGGVKGSSPIIGWT